IAYLGDEYEKRPLTSSNSSHAKHREILEARDCSTRSRPAIWATFVAMQTGFRVKFALPCDASAQGQGRQRGVGGRGRLETQEAHEQRPVDDPPHALRRRNIRLYRGRF
ncbi:hypothetical protein MSG28_007690, partial [Choristoneura fumiferana]